MFADEPGLERQFAAGPANRHRHALGKRRVDLFHAVIGEFRSAECRDAVARTIGHAHDQLVVGIEDGEAIRDDRVDQRALVGGHAFAAAKDRSMLVPYHRHDGDVRAQDGGLRRNRTEPAGGNLEDPVVGVGPDCPQGPDQRLSVRCPGAACARFPGCCRICASNAVVVDLPELPVTPMTLPRMRMRRLRATPARYFSTTYSLFSLRRQARIALPRSIREAASRGWRNRSCAGPASSWSHAPEATGARLSDPPSFIIDPGGNVTALAATRRARQVPRKRRPLVAGGSPDGARCRVMALETARKWCLANQTRRNGNAVPHRKTE